MRLRPLVAFAVTAASTLRVAPPFLDGLRPAPAGGPWPVAEAGRTRSDRTHGGTVAVLPIALRHAAVDDLPPPPTAAATPTHTTAPSPTATASPTPTAGPGVPRCERTTGDAGGFRFSLDDGATLAPNARRLERIAYTWDLDVDPRDPDVILEVHQGRLFRSRDAGCTFAAVAGVPDGEWDRLVQAPSDPDVLVLTTIAAPRLAYSADGGTTWTKQDLPDDVVELAIDPSDPWRWTFVGRGPAIHSRTGVDARWTALPVPLGGSTSIVSAAYAPARPQRWLVGSATHGVFVTDDAGRTWAPGNDGLFGPVGDPAEPTQAVVPASLTFAPSDPDVAFAVVNQVGRGQSLRGIWRSADGGRTWVRRVANGDLVGNVPARLTGGTRVFVSPHDPDRAFFAFGIAYDGYGTDLFGSRDGLRSMRVSHFADFYKVYAMAFGPPGTAVVFVGASSDVPSLAGDGDSSAGDAGGADGDADSDGDAHDDGDAGAG